MKKTAVSCLVLITLMFITNLLLVEAASAPNPVLDTTGKMVRTGLDYLVVPVRKDLGAELGLTFIIGAPSCPLGIGPRYNPNDGSLPINFFSVNSKKGVIRESTDLNVEFRETYTMCQHHSNVWMLDHYNPQKEDHVITIGGVKGNPGRDTIANWFKIVKYGAGYKFVFCPSVCNYCEVICNNIGVFVQNNGEALLTLSNEPFEVVFEKV